MANLGKNQEGVIILQTHGWVQFLEILGLGNCISQFHLPEPVDIFVAVSVLISDSLHP